MFLELLKVSGTWKVHSFFLFSRHENTTFKSYILIEFVLFFFFSPLVLGIESRIVLPLSYTFSPFYFISEKVLLNCLCWPRICDPPVSTSLVTGIIGAHHCTWPEFMLLKRNILSFSESIYVLYYK